ncbi:DNA replication/repair protein RecF [Streptococcus pluranimalium]|uniref:DNA replication/repair protein RecF n=1 Tax=Streptococcus pluranimalium TaxID=82348 RepID=UPI003F67A11A
MWIESITLNHYRNYLDISANFSPNLNVFIGRNAQGKTNFLEAIYFLSLTRSHRTRSDKELIAFNQDSLHLSGIVHKQNGKVPLEIHLSDKGRITKVNHLKQNRLSDYIGNLTVVLFAPEDLQLIKGSPSLRRKFLDIDLGQIKTIYLSDLSQYNHVLKQRNTYLKNTEKVDTTFLSVLDEQLADFGSRVMIHRHKFIKDLEIEAAKHHATISEDTEVLKITYDSSVKFTDLSTLRQDFLQQLTNQHRRDIFKKNTGIGPHRDDMAFFINDMNASFGSQGQHRSLILSLKMAEIELIKQSTGDYPILLLDDVMSELDNHRQAKLLEAVLKENVQTFITTTSLDHLKQVPENMTVFAINQGAIKSGS